MAKSEEHERWVPTGEVVEFCFGGKVYKMRAKAPQSKVQQTLDFATKEETDDDDNDPTAA